MVRKIPDSPPPGEVPKTGFYDPLKGPWGASVSVAGILLSGMQKVINTLLGKADKTNKEYERLREVQAKVDELMKLLTKVEGSAPLPPTFAADIEGLIGTSGGDPGELGRLIASLETSGSRQTLNSQLEEVRKGVSVVDNLKEIAQAIRDFKAFWVEVISSKGAILSTEEGRIKLRNLLLTLQSRMNFLGQIVESARDEMPRGPFGVPLPGNPKVFGSEELYAATHALYMGIKEIFEGLNVTRGLIPGSNPLAVGGQEWDQTVKFLQERMKNPVEGYGLPGLGRLGDYYLIDNVLSSFGALEGALGKVSLQTMLEEVHRKMNESTSTTDWAVEGYRDAVRSISKMVNTCAQTTPDVMSELKATMDEVNQLVQQLRSVLGIANRTVENSLGQIRPKG